MTELAKRYGDSLYELAAEEALTEQFQEELDTVAGLFAQNPDYVRLLSRPSLPKKERTGLLDEALGAQLHPYVVNFLKILCEEGNLREFSGCRKEFTRRFNEDHGILEVTAVCAVELSEPDRARLLARLSAMTGKTIRLSTRIDPAVLGGVRLDMGGVQLDGTIRHRLETLRADISGAVL